MTPLRKRMIEELQLRSLSLSPRETYVRTVERFPRYFHRSPDQLGPEQVRDYLLHLANDNHANANTLLFNRAALRFVYVSTLKQKWFDDEIARAKRRPTLPPTLSVEEVTRILHHTRNLKHWTILATFYATALRCNELRHLKLTALDRQRMVIHVREGKGGIPVTSPPSSTLLERSRVYFRWRPPTDWRFPSKQRTTNHSTTGPSATCAATPAGAPASHVPSSRSCSATPAPPICSTPAPICAPSRSC